ncbi:hypothetical protein AA313_de0209138 [Arthrobotrys entomopaga]|nr:hypothetical protein AA313_de0209138 [Arthrobotrys entomopaga]
MELSTSILEWLHRDGSLALGSTVFAFAIFTLVFYHCLVPSKDPRDPPLIPYTLPWLGSALSFTGDYVKFIKWIRDVMPPEIPYRLYMGGQTLYLINSPRLYAKVVRISKTMSFDLLEREIFIKIFEMEKKDLDRFCIGMHGMPPPPRMSKEEADEMALSPIWMKQYHDNLPSGTKSFEFATKRFSTEWEKHIQMIIGDKNKTRISMRRLMEHHFFWAASAVQLGTHMKEVAPDMAEQFWEFEAGFLKLFQDTPKWMLPSPIKARDEIIAGLERWIVQGDKHAPNLPDDLIWDEWWGSRILRQRVQLTRAAGLSLRSQATHQFGLLLALNANTIPAVSWMMIYILRNPDLIPRLREEAATAIKLKPSLEIDFKTLVQLPLFVSILRETLRLAVSNMTARVVTDDTELEGYILKKGRMLVAPSYALHLSPVFDNPEHPATEFWADRFMVEGPERTKLLNSWRPFAGGITYCPGRFLVSAELFSLVGMLILQFDMTLEEVNGTVQHTPGRGGTGAVRPDRDSYIVMKRRE